MSAGFLPLPTSTAVRWRILFVWTRKPCTSFCAHGVSCMRNYTNVLWTT